MPAEPLDYAFEKKLAEQAASTAFQLVWGLIEKIGKKGWEKVKVEEAMHRYATTYRERHGEVKVLGMSQPVPLHQIYTKVRVVSSAHLHAFTDEAELEADFKQGARRVPAYANEYGIRDGIEVANGRQFLNLLGAPGAGKSTFLRRLGHEALLTRTLEDSLVADAGLVTKYGHARLPVLIELRRFRHEAIDLVARLADEFETCGFPRSREFVEGALKQGGLLVLLDGLDEVPDNRLDEVIGHTRDFVDRFGQKGADGNRFVTSCRTAHYKNFFTKFTDVVLADFSDEQIAQFARNWFSSTQDRKEKVAERFHTLLKESQNAGALELARTPLLLTFLCLTFAHGQELPPTRATLYRRALDILLREWNSSKRVHNEPAYQELNAELELDLLAEMAAGLFAEDRFFFRRQKAVDQIRKFMASELNAPKSLDADKVLEAIEVQQGLIVKRASDAYSFSHLTIQEYLTARKLWEEGELAWCLVVNDHLFEPRWAIVFELMAGMGKADALLLAMAERANNKLREATSAGGLKGLLSWLGQQAAPQDKARPQPGARVMSRLTLLGFAFAITLARDRDRDRSLALAFALDRHRAFARALALDLALDLDRDRALDRALDQARDLARARTLDLDRALDNALALALACRSRSLTGALSVACNRKLDESIGSLAANSSNSWVQLDHVARVVGLSDAVLERHDTEVLLVKVLDAYGLILRCKQAAYRVSAPGWDAVQDTFLHLPELE